MTIRHQGGNVLVDFEVVADKYIVWTMTMPNSKAQMHGVIAGASIAESDVASWVNSAAEDGLKYINARRSHQKHISRLCCRDDFRRDAYPMRREKG